MTGRCQDERRGQTPTVIYIIKLDDKQVRVGSGEPPVSLDEDRVVCVHEKYKLIYGVNLCVNGNQRQ